MVLHGGVVYDIKLVIKRSWVQLLGIRVMTLGKLFTHSVSNQYNLVLAKEQRCSAAWN